MYRLILFTIAVGLLIAFLYVMHIWKITEAGTSEGYPVRNERALWQLTLLRRIVLVVFCVCLFLILAMTLMVLGQEFLFLRWTAAGITMSRPAAHTPYFVLMFELGGLGVMHLALFLLIRSALRDVARSTNIKHPQGTKKLTNTREEKK